MYLGIDLGGTHIAAGLVNEEGKLLKKVSCSNLINKTYKEYVKNMADLCKKILDEEGMAISQIKSVGIGIPGTPNNTMGTVTCNSSIKLDDAPIREEFQKYYNIEVNVENDANCAALAEAVAGAAKDVDHSVTITLGTGIGVGIVINKKVYSGFNYAGAEAGHIVIVTDGEKCPCGRSGCWEAYSSAPALIREAKKLLQSNENKDSLILKMANGDLSRIDGRIIFEASKQGDKIAKEVIDKYAKYLSEGVANIINVLMPEVFVIGGGISRQGDYLLDMIRSRVYEKIYTKSEPKTVIKVAELGVDAGLIGAAMLGK
ncbi:MAG: ROK family protein [Ignavibacteriales bacterium]